MTPMPRSLALLALSPCQALDEQRDLATERSDDEMALESVKDRRTPDPAAR